MKIIKRDGTEVENDKGKNVKAINAANRSVAPKDELPMEEAERIAQDIQDTYKSSTSPLSVEEVQDMVIYRLMQAGAYRLAQNYTVYRYKHELIRKANSTDKRILSIVNGTNADAKTENSNKNPDIISVQRDYIAGETSRDITERILLPDDVVAAHKEGIIHFHDTDYFLTKEHNCSLVNIDDMLQNGTIINGTLIERPHRFSTACNIATQIIAQVASSQYGLRTAVL